MLGAGWLRGLASFPTAGRDAAAHSNVLWRSSAYIALTVCGLIRGCMKGVSWAGKSRPLLRPKLHVLVPKFVNRGSEVGRRTATNKRSNQK